MLIPYTEGALVSRLHRDQKILEEEYAESGTKLKLLADSATYDTLKEYILNETG